MTFVVVTTELAYDYCGRGIWPLHSMRVIWYYLGPSWRTRSMWRCIQHLLIRYVDQAVLEHVETPQQPLRSTHEGARPPRSPRILPARVTDTPVHKPLLPCYLLPAVPMLWERWRSVFAFGALPPVASHQGAAGGGFGGREERARPPVCLVIAVLAPFAMRCVSPVWPVACAEVRVCYVYARRGARRRPRLDHPHPWRRRHHRFRRRRCIAAVVGARSASLEAFIKMNEISRICSMCVV